MNWATKINEFFSVIFNMTVYTTQMTSDYFQVVLQIEILSEVCLYVKSSITNFFKTNLIIKNPPLCVI